MIKIIFTALVVLLLLLAVCLFVFKAGLQLQYLQLKAKKKTGTVLDFLQFDLKDATSRKLRGQAFLLFPMLYPIELNEKDERLNQIKRKVKKIHIGIYLLLIALIIFGIFSEKVFPVQVQ